MKLVRITLWVVIAAVALAIAALVLTGCATYVCDPKGALDANDSTSCLVVDINGPVARDAIAFHASRCPSRLILCDAAGACMCFNPEGCR